MPAVTQETSRVAVSAATETIPATPPVNREAEIMERSLIDSSTSGPVLAFFGTGILWLLFSTLLGLIVSIKLHSPGFLGNIEWLTYGRVYPAFTNAFTY